MLQATSDKTEWLNGQHLEFHIFTMNLYAQPHYLSLPILLLIQILERYLWDPGFHYITLLTGNRDLPRFTDRMCIFLSAGNLWNHHDNQQGEDQNQDVHYASEIGEFSANYTEFSSKHSLAYDYFLFRCGASSKVFSCNTTPFSRY